MRWTLLLLLLKFVAITVPLTWLFSIVGIADLANALRQAEAVPHFEAAWYIPTFVVPVLLVTHAMIVYRLCRHHLVENVNPNDR